MKSLLLTWIKKLAWGLLVILVLLAGAWMCWLYSRLPATWPTFPWELPNLDKTEQTQ